MNTSALENKIAAISIVGAVAQALGVHFSDYVQTVATLVSSELMHDKYSSSVRKEATRLCAALLDCCTSH